jgi:hypothetical protein
MDNSSSCTDIEFVECVPYDFQLSYRCPSEKTVRCEKLYNKTIGGNRYRVLERHLVSRGRGCIFITPRDLTTKTYSACDKSILGFKGTARLTCRSNNEEGHLGENQNQGQRSKPKL